MGGSATFRLNCDWHAQTADHSLLPPRHIMKHEGPGGAKAEVVRLCMTGRGSLTALSNTARGAYRNVASQVVIHPDPQCLEHQVEAAFATSSAT